MALYVGMGGGCHPDLLLVVRGGGRADHPLQLQQVQQQHPQVGNGVPEYCLRVSEQKYP